MSANETIRLLVINDSREEVERLVSMLNNAGRSVRPQHVESEEGLIKLLEEQSWDLLIAQASGSHLPPATAIRQIKRLNRDVPVILISDEEGTQPVVEGLKQGACDVVLLDQDQHLLQVMQRELENREHRQRRRLADRKLREAERRGQQLLDSSRDAIAYVQDGMYLYVNQSFADRFGYDDKDEMDCMPVIDMVADSDQGKVRQFLKEFSFKGEEAESCQLEVQGVRSDGGLCPLMINVAMAIYDEEECIQFQLPSIGSPATGALHQQPEVKDRDPLTQLYNRQFLADRLERELSKNLDAETTSSLLYIEIDNFTEALQPRLGMSASEQLLVKVAEFLNSHKQDGDVLARFSDHAYILLRPDQSADASLQYATQLCQDLQQTVLQLENRSLQITASVGISVVNENTSSSEEAINHGIRAVESLRRDSTDSGNGARVFEIETPTDEKSERDIARQVEQAIANNRFQLVFQPIISLRGSEEEHYEVFLRMLDEEDDLATPDEFMKAVENIGASTKVDRWVILETIKMLGDHRSRGHNTRVIINLTSHSMCDESLVPWLKVAFQAADLQPHAVVFQVEEAAVASHLNEARSFFQSLAQLGASASISNFGSTLNPFATLETANPTYVKVHGSFTQDIANNSDGPEVLRNLIQKLLEHEKITIAPFVESASTLSTLWQTGVHYIQGHYLQEPSQSMNYDFNMEG